MIEFAVQWLFVTVLLVVLNGAAEQLPWGIGSARHGAGHICGAAL
jgi:hypothetical protein